MAEKYEGVKFNYKSIGKTIQNHALLPDLMYWCQFFYKNNLAPPYPGGSSGNLSFRTKPGFIITASHTALKTKMAVTDFSEVTNYFNGENLITGIGNRAPSSESIMHFLIYKNRSEINAVFHGHSPEILTHAHKLNLPFTEKELAYGTYELASDMIKLLKKDDFIILKNHGFVSLGKTMHEAGKQTEYYLNKCK